MKGAEVLEGPVSEPVDYEVGYAKPPRHSRFKPGQSGNPKGRPKLAKSLNTIIRSRMLETVQVKTSQGITRVSRAEALLLKAMEAGSKGDLRAIERLLAMFAAAVPEPQSEMGAAHTTACMDITATDQLTLALLRAELTAELQSKTAGEAVDLDAQEGDHA
jgi:hypothetical protein